MTTINQVVLDGAVSASLDSTMRSLIEDFIAACDPLEKSAIDLFTDGRTGARYIECHVRAAGLVGQGTIDVPLDPEEQPEYRANREVVEDHSAFEKMKEDASARRAFSNIVTEFTRAFDADKPLKIIGGQHRFLAIQEALGIGTNEFHGVKVYFGLNPDQRLDVQLISNMNIAVSTDLFDRMQETLAGPDLRKWCQDVGLLELGKDFSDRRLRGNPITVRAARTFIVNYYRGLDIDSNKFDEAETIPVICKSGIVDEDWNALKARNPGLWKDAGLKDAGQAFAALSLAQSEAFKSPAGKKAKVNVDFSEKAINFAILSAWAFAAGLLQGNKKRLEKHYSLKDQVGRDPLNAAALAKGRHRTDSENYRGLGYRTDAKERGRLTELFYLQAELGGGITASLIDIAIKKYHAKEAHLEVVRAQQRGVSNG